MLKNIKGSIILLIYSIVIALILLRLTNHRIESSNITIIFINIIIISLTVVSCIRFYQSLINKNKIVLIFVLSSVCIVSLYALLLSSYLLLNKKQINKEAFDQTVILDYINLRNEVPLHPYEEKSARGPIVIVDVNNESIHPMFFGIPKKLAAETPNDVKTIVCIKKAMSRIFTYDVQLTNDVYKTPVAGFRVTWEMMAIDKATQKLIYYDVYVSEPRETGMIKYISKDDILYDEFNLPGITGNRFKGERDAFAGILDLCRYSSYMPWLHNWENWEN